MVKPSFGPASILGYLSAAAGFVVATVLSIEHSQALLTGQNKPAALIGFIALLATNAHRAFESAHLNKAAAVAGEIADALPPALEGVPVATNPPPDGVDGPQVEFSGAEPPAA